MTDLKQKIEDEIASHAPSLGVWIGSLATDLVTLFEAEKERLAKEVEQMTTNYEHTTLASEIAVIKTKAADIIRTK